MVFFLIKKPAASLNGMLLSAFWYLVYRYFQNRFSERAAFFLGVSVNPQDSSQKKRLHDVMAFLIAAMYLAASVVVVLRAF